MLIRPGSEGFIRRDLVSAHEYLVFLSSGSDVLEERDHFEEIVKVANDQIHWAGWRRGRFHIRVVRWEQDAAHRTGGDPNAAFRAQAASAHATIVLLHNDIRPGTQDELEAALTEPSVQISVIWMEPTNPRRRLTRTLRRYLSDKQDLVIWEKTGPPGTRAVTLSMLKVVTRVMAELSNPELHAPPSQFGAVHYEDR